MKRLLSIIYTLVLICPLFSYKIYYAEQYYKIFHRHFYAAPDDVMENIVWLEQALKADFCNPLYALAKINNQKEWKHYRYLFKMHINLKLVEMYLLLGAGYDKETAYFYNAPWKEANLKSLDTAEWAYNTALYYWNSARQWASKLRGSPYHLEDIQYWEDEKYRILTGDLDYRDIITEHLRHLEKVRQDFLNMDEKTY